MRSTFSLFSAAATLVEFLLIASLSNTLAQAVNDCTVSLPRLLIGDHYNDSTNRETAMIMFDTPDECTEATLIVTAG